MAEGGRRESERLQKERRILIIGKTGTGKSATGNTILGKIAFTSKPSASSVTEEALKGEAKRFEKDLLVTDTPGFCDTRMPSADVTKEIIKSIAMISPGPHAIVLVIAIGRFTTEDQNVVRLFYELFGKEMYKHMIVVFTGRDNIERDGMSIEDYVRGGDHLFGDLLKKCDQRYLAFDNTPKLPSPKRDEKCNQRCLAFDNTPKLATGNRDDDAKKLIDLVEQVISENKGQCYTSEMFDEVEKQFQLRLKEIEDQKNKVIEQIRTDISDMNEQFKQIKEINTQYLKDLENARSMYREEVENEDKVVLKNLSTGLYRIALGLWNAAKKPFLFLGSFIFKK